MREATEERGLRSFLAFKRGTRLPSGAEADWAGNDRPPYTGNALTSSRAVV